MLSGLKVRLGRTYIASNQLKKIKKPLTVYYRLSSNCQSLEHS